MTTPTALAIQDQLMPDMEQHHHQEHQPNDINQELATVDDFPTHPPDDWPLPNDPNAIPSPLTGSPLICSARNSIDRETMPRRTSSNTSNTSISSRARRSSSTATNTSSHRKRLSLNLPVAANTSVNIRYGPHSANPSVPGTPSPTANVNIEKLDPNDPGAFLTALAAQERKVLELREELTRAESELTQLKRQWAVHEATRKRHELLQTATRVAHVDLESGGGTGERAGVVSPTFIEERLRRQAAMAKWVGGASCSSPGGSGGRKVTSQTHQRTLSLLSPHRASYPLPFSEVHDTIDDDDPKKQGISRADTQPLPSRPTSMIENPKRKSQDILLQTGKQMAEDFREGLWNFIEDLRQATVGDDNIHQNPRQLQTSSKPSSIRKQGSKASLHSNNSSTGDADDAWETASTEAQDAAEQHTNKATNARWSNSTVQSDIGSLSSLTQSRSSTPRTSTSSVQSNHIDNANLAALQIPLWGPIMSAPSSLPFNLKKTATAIINQVEKTLAVPASPPPTNNYPVAQETSATGKSTAISGRDAGRPRSNSPVVPKPKKA